MRSELERRLARLPAGEREAALAALEATGAATAHDLLALLERDGEEAEARSSAAWLLARLGDRRTLPGRVGRLLWRGDDDRRSAAAVALALLGGLRARRELRRTLQLHPDAEVRALAAWALGFAGGADDAALLAERLADAAEADAVRAAAAEALGHLFLGAQLPDVPARALAAAAADASPGVSSAAAAALRETSRGQAQGQRP